MKKILTITIIIIAFLIVASFGWSIVNTQSCKAVNLPKEATCEQIAENNSKNCKYVFLKWKSVEYDKELKSCNEWEQNAKNK